MATSQPLPDDLLREREISFCTLHPDPDQAATAVAMLLTCDGITHAERLAPGRLLVHYNLRETRLAWIEKGLELRGFHLDNSLMARMRRALVHYLEDTECHNRGCGKGESNCTTKVFINRYRQRQHGCQDERPRHWRRYL